MKIIARDNTLGAGCGAVGFYSSDEIIISLNINTPKNMDIGKGAGGGLGESAAYGGGGDTGAKDFFGGYAWDSST
jgi:hypothetical protein